MQIIPAIDFKDGKVVNLKQGQLDRSTVYSDDPVSMADHWVSQGCERLHLVDLDGAFEGSPVNAEAISQIASNHPNLVIQLGGGIRDESIIEGYLHAGVDYLIVGIDGLHGMVAINGWKEVTDIAVKSLAMLFDSDGVEAIVYTDIGKDGMMGGINMRATKDLADSVSVPIIASGGVHDISDIEKLVELEDQVTGGISGVITGRALYEGTLDLSAAIALSR